MENSMRLEVSAHSVNESFVRNAIAAFSLPLNPSISQLADVKTAVSEAVTNCIVHAYRGADWAEGLGKIVVEAKTFYREDKGVLHIQITDFGRGIADVAQALSPFYTTLEEEERSGIGFTAMQTFTDKLEVTSELGKGTSVWMEKIFVDEE